MSRRVSEFSEDVTVYLVLNDFRTGSAYVETPRMRPIAKPSSVISSVGNIRTRGAQSPSTPSAVSGYATLNLGRGVPSFDALCHSVEHTMLVTLAGHDIFKGRALLMPSTPSDYSNFIVACLTHDIGYVRGIIKGDADDSYVIDATGRRVSLPADRQTPPSHHITSSGRSCSLWIV
jgi:hypothetical protein